MIRNLGQVAAIYIGSSQPTNTNLIWLDNTVVPYAFRAYDGSTWSELATRDWVKMFVDGWLVSLPPSTQAGDTDYLLINSNNVNYKITVKEFVKSAVGNPLDFKGVIRTDADFPNPANCEAGDMYVIITSPAGGTVTDPYSGQVFEDTEKIVWDEVTKSWASLGKIEINVDLSTDYSATNVTINSSAGKSTTIEAASTSLAGVMLPQQVKRLTYLSNGSTVPGDPSELDPDTPAHKHNYGDILDRLISQQETGDSTFHPMSQKATTDNLDLKFDKANVVQVQGASTVMVMSQKAVTDAITTLDEWIKNELTKYLPLSGGDMTGDITLGNSVYILGDNTSGRSLRIAGVNANNQVVIGSLEAPTYILSNSSDLIHSRNNVSYKILDSYNLPDPATLSGDNTWTGTNTFNGITNINNSFVLANSKALQGRNVAGTLNYAIGQVNANNNVEVGDTRVPLMLVSNDSNLIHYRGTTTYGIWDAYNLPDPAAKSADNVFTGTNSFTAGKFNVGPFNVTATGSLLIDMVNTGGWERSIMWSNNSAPASRIRFGSYGNDNVAEYAWIGIGDVEYNTAQYRFYNTSMRVPSVWSLDDAGGNSFIQSQSTQLINFGRSAGTTKIRSGVTDLIHTKETTDYTIWDASNLTSPLLYASGTTATPTTVYNRNLEVNGSQWTFLSATNAATTSIYAPTAAGTSGQVLTSTGGIPTWSNISSVVDSRYVLKSGDTMTGNLTMNGGWLAFSNNDWTNEGGVYKEVEGSLKVWRVSTDAENKPSAYGSVLQINSRSGHWNTQLWIDQTNTAGNNGKLRYRSTKTYSSVEWNNWTVLATEPYVSSNYLPLTGGTLSGNLTINTAGSTTFVINNNDTNGSETFMRVLRKGTASAAIGFMDSLGAYIYNYNSNKYLFIDNDGYARVGTISGSTRLALITDIPTVSGYLPLSGGTLTGALTMSSRRNNVVVDVVGGAGNSWDEGAGALSIQVPNDSGQTPLILARRSGAAINTTVATERLLSMELLDTGHSFIIGMSGSEALQLDWTPGKAGTGKLFGKTIATTDQIPSIPSISISNSGSGNAVTAITASGHTLTVTKGATYLTSSSLSGYATQSWVTSQGYLTSSSLSGYATQEWVNSQNFVKSTSTKKVTDIQVVDALPATQASGVLYLVVK